MSAPNYLVVPILVDALRLTERRHVLAPPSFAELPYVGTDRYGNKTDIQGNRPFLAETTHAPAFNPPEFPLDPGVHLHWILPRALRTGKTQDASFEFPPAPDQWIVIRRRTQDATPGASSAWTVERVWRVDGGVVWPEPGADAPPWHEGVLSMAAGDSGRPGPAWLWQLKRDESGIPVFDGVEFTRPWRHVGQTWHCTAANWAADAAPDVGGTRLESCGRPLTAAGWGDPAFSGFYPGCAGQFGHFDDGIGDGGSPVDLDNGVEYVVVGWHGNAANDPLARIQPDIADFKTQNTKADDLNKAVQDLLGRKLGWEIELTNEGATPTASLYVGRVSCPHFLRPADERTPLQFDVAIGATGTQAMAALLSSEMAKNWPQGTGKPSCRGLERQLDAVVFEKQLARRTVDVGVTLDDFAAQRSFKATGGGQRWLIRGKAPAGSAVPGLPYTSAPRPDDSIELPEDLADDLDTLNEAQERLDKALRLLTAQREQLYTDWYRATAATYPTTRFALDWVLDLDTSDHPMVTDDLWRLIRQARLPAMQTTMTEITKVNTAIEGAKAKISDGLDKHNAQPGAPQWELAPAPAAPFYTPAEMAVTMVPRGGDGSFRMRWRGEGLEHNDNGWLKTKTTDKLPTNASDLQALLSLGLALDPAVSGDETPPLRMDWRAQFAARVVTDQQGSYTPDWITSLPASYEEAVEHSGTSLLTEQARPPLEAALLSCLRTRLAEKVLLVRNNVEVLASEELTAPIDAKTEKRISWLAHLNIDESKPVDDQVRVLETKLSPPDPSDPPQPISNAERMRLWFDDWTRVTTCTLAGKDQLAWSTPPPPSGTTAPKLAQYPAKKSPITAAVFTWLHSNNANLPAWVQTALGPNDAWQSNGTLCAALLQAAEAAGALCGEQLCPSVWGRPFIHGIPDGGALAAAVVKKANNIDEATLDTCLSFSDAATAAILEQRPFGRLADLARLPVVDGIVISALLRAVEDDLSASLSLDPPSADAPDDVPILIDPIVTVLTAWEELQRRPGAMVLTLDGFNDALLQLDASPQFPVADPMGFPDHQDITDTVIRPAVANARRCAPRPDFSFAPLRAGAVALTGLRLVDTFGFVRELPAAAIAKDQLVVPRGWKKTLHTDFSAELPPQLLQAARLNFRWLDGEDPARRWTPHPGRSPLCGWLVANTFDTQLDFHAPDGPFIGSLDADYDWHVAPGRKGPAVPSAIVQPGLRALAVALAALRPETGMSPVEDPIINASAGLEQFLNDIDFALEDIHPDSNVDDKALSLLMSRPIAVVQATLALELARPPCARQDALGVNLELEESTRRLGEGESLDGLTARLGDDPRYRRSFDQVEVPVTIGAQRRLGDGVVAWCEVYPSGDLGPLQFPHRSPVPLTLLIDPTAPPKTLLLLVDPAAQIHLQAGTGGTYSTAFLPPLSVSLPAHAVDRATRARELCAYSGPHLTPRTDLHAPVLRESGWDTAMLFREPGKWVELSSLPLIDRKALEARLDAPTGVWARLVREGILLPAPAEPSLAYLAPLPTPPKGAPPVPLEDRLQGYPNAVQLITALKNCGRSFSPPLATLISDPLELREGYLTVRPAAP